MKNQVLFLGLLVGMVICLQPVAGWACSFTLTPSRSSAIPDEKIQNFPTNGLFTTTTKWVSPGGKRLELVEDKDLTALLGIPAKRPKSGSLPANTLFSVDNCSRCATKLQTASQPDKTPPPQAVISDIKVRLVRSPLASHPVNCPDLDFLEFAIKGKDDTTPEKYVNLLAYIGPKEADVQNKTKPDVIFSYNRSPEKAGTAMIILGVAAGQKRNGKGFGQKGPFCFSIAMMDWAGNIGKRSKAHCLDTTDVNGPHVEWRSGQAGCGCEGTPGGLSNPLWFGLAFVLLLYWVRRRTRSSIHEMN